METKPVEFGDYLFIQETPKTVSLAELFKTLPVEHEHYKKNYEILGRASKRAILSPACMDPERTIVLVKKLKVKWLPASWCD